MAQLLHEGTVHDWPEFDRSDESIQAMIALAHTVDGYARHADADAWQTWYPTICETLRSGRLSDVTTQYLLDGLFLICRNDRHGGDGSVYREPWFIGACNEVRRRALKSREPDLSQEELLRQPVFIPYRPRKDPRDIKMLDPACGSMHFGLYAFDLFERIYQEYFENVSGQSSVVSGDAADAQLPPDNCQLPTAHPRLIIERNIHGIDIDPRAVQIAGLSLWLRAQRSWHERGIKAAERPRIERSNIVCAEPMPGDERLLDEFLKSLQRDRLEGLIRRVLDVPETQQVRATERMAEALCGLVRTVWNEMKLAGEAVSLLKIEGSLREAIEAGKDEWEEKLPLFRITEFGLDGQAEKTQYLRSIPGPEEDFWSRAEQIVLAALQAYAEQAENGGGFQRRLFASDAARGFAFIDVCRQRYDVVLMNPPFGNPPVRARGYLSASFPKLWADIYAACVERSITVLTMSGRVGAITSRTFLALSSFEPLRDLLLEQAPIRLAVECGLGVRDDATVRAAFFVAERSLYQSSYATFWDLRSSLDREADLFASISRRTGYLSHHVTPERFWAIPGKPFAYWLPDPLLNILAAVLGWESYSGDGTSGGR